MSCVLHCSSRNNLFMYVLHKKIPCLNKRICGKQSICYKVTIYIYFRSCSISMICLCVFLCESVRKINWNKAYIGITYFCLRRYSISMIWFIKNKAIRPYDKLFLNIMTIELLVALLFPWSKIFYHTLYFEWKYFDV